MIPYGRQTISEADVAAVSAVLRGDWLTQGPTVAAFEQAVARYVHADHAVAFSNGTAALHGACAAAGVGPGDRVLTPSLTFVASANCARYVGADVSFLDIDPLTLNADLAALDEGADVLIGVHFAGLPLDLRSLTNRPRVVIEDAAQGLGALTPDGPVGNCAHSDMTCFSFHPVKPVTTGEGGVVTTNNPDFAERLRRFRSHGIERRPERGGWYYEISEIGMNYRLSDIHAALGLSQMGQLDTFIDRRQEIAKVYDAELVDLPLTSAPLAPTGFRHGYHLYPVRVPNRRAVYDHLHAHGVAVQVHYVPVHHHPLYHDSELSLPHTDAAYEGLLSLPIYPTLDERAQRKTIDEIGHALEKCST
jgi:UDP-4-amino-4,6-dideoxy-N-acetyl-beta-L-altrosamine transaminase